MIRILLYNLLLQIWKSVKSIERSWLQGKQWQVLEVQSYTFIWKTENQGRVWHTNGHKINYHLLNGFHNDFENVLNEYIIITIIDSGRNKHWNVLATKFWNPSNHVPLLSGFHHSHQFSQVTPSNTCDQNGLKVPVSLIKL